MHCAFVAALFCFMIATFLSGLGTGAGLIIAIGAQNAFVLRQGLLRQYVLPVVLVCIIGDVLCICAGVAGPMSGYWIFFAGAARFS